MKSKTRRRKNEGKEKKFGDKLTKIKNTKT